MSVSELEARIEKGTQQSVAEAYAGLLRFDRGLFTPVLGTDMGTINRAIVARWSLAGLKRVKQLAWRLAAEREGVLEPAR